VDENANQTRSGDMRFVACLFFLSFYLSAGDWEQRGLGFLNLSKNPKIRFFYLKPGEIRIVYFDRDEVIPSYRTQGEWRIILNNMNREDSIEQIRALVEHLLWEQTLATKSEISKWLDLSHLLPGSAGVSHDPD